MRHKYICAALLEHAHMFVQPLGHTFPFNLHFSNKITTISFGRQVPVCMGRSSVLEQGWGQAIGRHIRHDWRLDLDNRCYQPINKQLTCSTRSAQLQSNDKYLNRSRYSNKLLANEYYTIQGHWTVHFETLKHQENSKTFVQIVPSLWNLSCEMYGYTISYCKTGKADIWFYTP